MKVKNYNKITVVDNFILEFSEMMQRNIKELIKESCQIACAVYHMHFAERMSSKEIAKELEIEENFIDMYVQYYNRLLG